MQAGVSSMKDVGCNSFPWRIPYTGLFWFGNVLLNATDANQTHRSETTMQRTHLAKLAIATVLLIGLGRTPARSEGPLTVHTDNPRWLADASGQALFLTGSHTWAARQERGVEGETPDFDYEEFLDFLKKHDHNFLRLWAWEHTQWMQFVDADIPVRYAPNPYARTGPGDGLDGKPRFDLTRFNAEYFTRLRQRVKAAGERNIYVAVMLFQGFSLSKTRGDAKNGNAWHGHPMHAANNINGIDGNPSGDDTGYEVHELVVPEITALQEAFVRKVIDTVGDLDNVLWEITNESHADSVAWQYHMIRTIRDHESTRTTQHLIGMTGAPILIEPLLASPADWISPPKGTFINNPPVNDGEKIVIADSDHCDPWGHKIVWPWKHMLRGNHFILMDGYRDYRIGSPETPLPEFNDCRDAMGQTRRFTETIDLAGMLPMPGKASSGYCLLREGQEYVALHLAEKEKSLEVTLPAGSYSVRWVPLVRGKPISAGVVKTQGNRHRFEPPEDMPMVLHLKRVD